jgi:PAS domain-containing protein
MREDNEDSLLRSVALQNVESIRIARQRAERQVEATLWEQANLLNLTHDAILVRDMNSVINYWNRGAEERVDGGPGAEQSSLRPAEDGIPGAAGADRGGSNAGGPLGRRA